MKKILLFVIASIAFVACNDETAPTTNIVDKTFTLSVNKVTRAQFYEGDSIITLSKDEAVSVFDISEANRLFSIVSTDGAKVKISGSAKKSTNYSILAPYSEKYEFKDSYIKGLEVPAVQTPVANGFDPKAQYVFGVTTASETVTMRTMLPLMRVGVTIDGVDRIVFTPNHAERKAAGSFTIYASNGGSCVPVNTTPTVTLQASASAKIEKGKSYFFTVLPQTYTDGFTVTAVAADGKELYRIERRNDVSLMRSTVYDLCNIGDYKGTLAAADGTMREWVDLGLPSGTRWATENVTVDASASTLFAWGMTEALTDYIWDNYPYRGAATADDAATKLWGSNWKTPSMEQFAELANTQYCVWTHAEVNGQSGCKVTSISNGNSIFLPATGYAFGTEIISPLNGNYWTSSPRYGSTDTAYRFTFSMTESVSSGNVGQAYRYYGMALRPVAAQ